MSDPLNISRRTLLTGAMAGGALALGGHPTSGFAASTTSTYNPATETLQLNKIAKSRGLLYGSPINTSIAQWMSQLPGNASATWLKSPYIQMILRQCGIITNLFTWAGCEPVQGQPNTSYLAYKDALRNFWASQGLLVRGHNLCWWNGMPTWFAALPNRTAAINAMTNHIQTIVGARAGLYHSWDVANETVNPPDSLPRAMRAGSFTQMIGPDWMDFAYKAARAADPKALLVYNDYGTEITGTYGGADGKRTSTLALIDAFQQNNVPLDAIGIQSHMFYAQWQYFNASAFANYLAAIAQRGLKIFITEMDTIDVGTPTSATQRDPIIANIYQTYLHTALANPAVKLVETWGLCDPESWQLSEGTNAQFLRIDGTMPRVLPFDQNYMPKSAAQAIATCFTNAPSR